MADLLRYGTVQRRLDISESSLRRLVEAGELEPIRIGRSVRFAEADVDALIVRLQNADAAPRRTASSTSTITTDETGRDVEDEV